MTPDPSDLGGLVTTLIVTTVASLLIVAAVYVWTGLAMSRLFARLSVEPWRGWVPLLNVAEILALGGSPRWIALLFLVPLANIYALVMFAIAAHRVNALFGKGAGMTVLAVLVLPAWASVLAWGRDAPDPERGRLVTAVGGQARTTGPLAVPPQPVAPRPETPAGRGPTEPRAFPPLPGLEHQAPVRPGAQTPGTQAAPQPASAHVPPPPAAIAPPPGAVSTGWPVSPPARPAPQAATPTGTPAYPQQPPTGQPVTGPSPADRRAFPPPTGQPVAGQYAPPPADAGPAPAPQQSPAPPAAPESSSTPWAPGPDLATPPHGSAAAPAAPPAYSAPAPAPAPAPPTAAPVDDQHGGLDFADAATIVVSGDDSDDEFGDVESTVIVDRRPRRQWRLELDDGEVLPLTEEVVVLGRNPSAAAGEQRLAVPDRTRTLSKTHARLAQRHGAWTITDLGSTNGVLIVDPAGEETLIESHIETTISGRFVLGEVGMRVTEATA
ncbi:DUF5684 domain-containing protein [Agromyces silvae]|uniref:DUF5684 domain-containing protein n=1 Tax=Agromyces silvae TaxID=3388266 RepID=UPI00280BBEAC|nr:DUF5684 domain-containing protein [Agromyces protaetiae]